MSTLLSKLFRKAAPVAPVVRPAPARNARLGVEGLDERVVLSSTAGTIGDGVAWTFSYNAATQVYTFTVNDTDAAHTISLNERTNNAAEGEPGYGDTRPVGIDVQMGEYEGGSPDFAAGSKIQIVVNGKGGNDAIRNNTRFASYLYGDAGNDQLTGGSGVDHLLGGAGADVLIGGQGADVLKGGDGADQLWGDGRASRVVGGKLFYVSSSAGGNDVMEGGAGNDSLMGGAGNDNLDGGADSDYLFGGAGADVLTGGAGDDFLYGGVGVDSFDGGLGADKFVRDGDADPYWSAADYYKPHNPTTLISDGNVKQSG